MILLDETRLRRVIGDILDTAPGVPGAPLDEPASPARRRWHLDVVAAAVVVGIGIGGVVLVTRNDDGPTTGVAPTTPAATFVIPADGRLVFDPLPDEMAVTNAGRDRASSSPETQVYVENRDQPELGAALFVSAFEGGGSLPPREEGEAVTVQSAPGTAFTSGNGESVEFGPVDGVTFFLNGYGVTRDELLAIAEGARLGEHGTVLIEPALLRPGMTSLTAGSYGESSHFLPAINGEVDVVGASWLSDDGSRWLTYNVRAEYGNLFPVNRLGHNSVRDVEIGGLDGYVSVSGYLSGQTFIEVALTDGQRTLFAAAGSVPDEAAYTEDEIIALVATLRPVTDEEWAAMLLAGENGSGDISVGAPPASEG